MSQANQFTDPRENVSYEIQPGMVFNDHRPDEPREIVVEYAERGGGVRMKDLEGDANRDVVYLMDTYDAFEAEIGAGRYTPVTDDDGTIQYKGWMGQIKRLKDEYDNTDSRIADHKAEAISEVIDIIEDDMPDDHNDTIPHQEISGIGSKAAQSLINAGYKTKGDVRNASKSDLTDVPNIGSGNADNLMEYCE